MTPIVRRHNNGLIVFGRDAGEKGDVMLVLDWDEAAVLSTALAFECQDHDIADGVADVADYSPSDDVARLRA